MVSVHPNCKNGKIVSFKFKVFLGRDENRKQLFKCKTQTPEKSMTESRLIDSKSILKYRFIPSIMKEII